MLSSTCKSYTIGVNRWQKVITTQSVGNIVLNKPGECRFKEGIQPTLFLIQQLVGHVHKTTLLG